MRLLRYFICECPCIDGLEDSEIVDFLSSTFSVFGTVESIHVSSQGVSGGAKNWYCGGAYTARNSLLNPNLTKLSRFAHITFEKKAGLKFSLAATDGKLCVYGRQVTHVCYFLTSFMFFQNFMISCY